MKNVVLFFVFAVLFPSAAFAAGICTVQFTPAVTKVVPTSGQERCRTGDKVIIRSMDLDDVLTAREQFCAAGSYDFKEVIRQKSSGENIFEVSCKYIGAGSENTPQGVLITGVGERKFSPLTPREAIPPAMLKRYGKVSE